MTAAEPSQRERYKAKYMHMVHQWSIGKLEMKECDVFEVLYALHLDHLLWQDLPPDFGDTHELPHMRDYGVDTVSWEYTETCQVKHYGERSRISWGDIAKYMSYSADVLGIRDMCVGTTPDATFASIAALALRNKNVPVHRHSIASLMGTVMAKYAPVETPAHTRTVTPCAADVQIEPRPYLLAAHQTIVESAKPVLKLQLPCGTGKSYIMLHTMVEHLAKHPDSKFCVFSPWVDLAKQLAALFATRMRVLLIGETKAVRLPLPTTHAALPVSEHQVVVCVNPSVSHIPANEHYAIKFYDEAHHLEDVHAKTRPRLDAVPCDKTVLMSATFHHYDDLDFELSVREAIDQGHISDYVLHIEYFTSGDRTAGLRQMIVDHADWYPMFVYFNSTTACVAFDELLQQSGVRSSFLVGTDSAQKRESIRSQLESGDLHVLCLCGCFNEGISIDRLQTVVFGELRHSPINKIQIAMRANRKHATKPHYRVVLPVSHADLDGSDMRELVQSFARIDPKLHDVLETKNRKSSRMCVHVARPAGDSDDDNGVTSEEAELICEEVYDRAGKLLPGAGWFATLERVEAWIDEHGRRPRGTSTDEEEGFLGRWIGTQLQQARGPDMRKYIMKSDTIYQAWLDHVERHSKLYKSNEERWTDTLDKVDAWIAAHNKLPKQKSRDSEEEAYLAKWIGHQLQKAKPADIRKHSMTSDAIYQAWLDHVDRHSKLYKSKEEQWKDTLDKVEAWISAYKTRPKNHSKDSKEEAYLAQWTRTQLKTSNASHNRKHIMRSDTIYQAWLDHVDRHSKLYKSKEEQWKDTLDKVEAWISAYKTRPKNHSKDSKEAFLAIWINNQLHTSKAPHNRKHIMKSDTIYQAWLDHVERHSELYKTNEERWKDTLDKVDAWIAAHNKLPIWRSKDSKEEAFLAQWIGNQLHTSKAPHNRKHIMKSDTIYHAWLDHMHRHPKLYQRQLTALQNPTPVHPQTQ